MDKQLLLANILFNIAVVVVGLTVLLFFTFKVRMYRIQFEKYVAILKSQRRYEDWENKNHRIIDQLKIMYYLLVVGNIVIFTIGFFLRWVLILTGLIALGILIRSYFLYKRILIENTIDDNEVVTKLIS